MKKVNIKWIIILCTLLITSVSYAVSPSDYDNWNGVRLVPWVKPNELGLSRGILPGYYNIQIMSDPAIPLRYVYLWEQEGKVIYIAVDILAGEEWGVGIIYKYNGEGKPYIKIWPKKYNDIKMEKILSCRFVCFDRSLVICFKRWN